jgi:hypothetical protein
MQRGASVSLQAMDGYGTYTISFAGQECATTVQPHTVYLGAGGDGPYISDQVEALKEVGLKDAVAGHPTGGLFSNLAEIPWLTNRTAQR